MTYKHHLYFILGVLGVCMTGGHMTYTRHVHIKTVNKFDRAIYRHDFVVAVFINNECAQGKKHHGSVVGVVHEVDHEWTYKKAGVQFLMINVARDDLESLAHEYGVTEFPSVVLFKYGKLVHTADKKVSILTGCFTPVSLRNFIQEYLGQAIKDRIDDIMEERRERAIAASYYWYSPYWGYYGYPYYGWGRPWWW